MTNTKSNFKSKKHPACIISGFAGIGFCLYICAATICLVFYPLFLSIGGMLLLMLASFASLGAFSLVRYLFYANNFSESWAVLPWALSAISLFASGMTVGYLEGKLLPQEVEYRSLNLGGYKFLLLMAVVPLFMIMGSRLVAIQEDNPTSVDLPDPESILIVTNGRIANRKRDENNRIFEQAVFDKDTNRVYYSRMVP